MDFITGAWRNTKYTSLPSSFILGFIPTVGLITGLVINAVKNGEWVAMVPLSVVLILEGLFYPIARETYYRITQPLRRGLGGWIVPLPLVLIGWIFKLYIYLVLWTLAIPIGLAGFFYLATKERDGQGWRTVE